VIVKKMILLLLVVALAESALLTVLLSSSWQRCRAQAVAILQDATLYAYYHPEARKFTTDCLLRVYESHNVYGEVVVLQSHRLVLSWRWYVVPDILWIPQHAEKEADFTGLEGRLSCVWMKNPELSNRSPQHYHTVARLLYVTLRGSKYRNKLPLVEVTDVPLQDGLPITSRAHKESGDDG